MSTGYIKFKSCPDCRYPSPYSQEMCPDCGHVYCTRFGPQGRSEYDGPRIVSALSPHIPPAPKEQMPVFCSRCHVRLDPGAVLCQSCGEDRRTSRPIPPSSYGQQQAQLQLQSLPQAYSGSLGYPQSAAYRGDIIQFPPGYFSTLAPILSAVFITGVGQMCNRQTTKGVVILLSSLIIGLLTLGVGALVVWLIALIDAIQIAGRLNRGEAVRAWQWF